MDYERKIEHSATATVEHRDVKSEPGLQVSLSNNSSPPTEHRQNNGVRYREVLKEHGVNYWGKGYIMLYLCCFLIYFNSTMKGYDSNMMATINVLPAYLEHFNLSGEASGTSLVFAIFQIGQMASTLLYWPMDIVGRRVVLFYCSIMVIASTVIQGQAQTISVFIAGRFVGAFFSTIASLTAVVYLVEIAPPLYRGAVAGMYNTLYYCGALIAAFAAYGVSIHFPGSPATWKVPVYLQICCPLIVASFIFLVPESPRWLVSRGRHELARAHIIKYHANGDDSHPIVDLEMREIEESLAVEDTAGSPWKTALDFRKLFSTRPRRYRSMLAGAMGWAGEFSGSNIASYYLPVMAQSVGIVSTDTLLLLTSMYAITSWIAALAGANLHDYFGRRKILISGMFGLVIVFAVMAITTATYEKNQSQGASYTLLVFIFLFGIVFSFAYTPMQQVYPAEVMDNSLRARGMAFFGFNSGLAAFINTIAGSVAIERISWRFYVFYAIWDCLMGIFIYYFFVETKVPALRLKFVGHMTNCIYRDAPSRNLRKFSTQRILAKSRSKPCHRSNATELTTGGVPTRP